MKKPKILVAALASAVMLMGAGYAYWSQEITIQNTVTTGYLDVQFTDANAHDYDDSTTPLSNYLTVDKAIASGGQSMTFSVGNMYPGSGASLDFEVENTGTVPARISGVSGSILNNAALADELEFYVDTVQVTSGPLGLITYHNITPVIANSVTDFAAQLENSGIKEIKLAPGDSLKLYNGRTEILGFPLTPGSPQNPGYDIVMPASIEGSDFENIQGENAAKFNLGLTFTQEN